MQISSFGSGLFGTAIFVLGFAALPYFSGFTYSEAYFRSFGISFSEANLSDREVFVAAFFAARRVFNDDQLSSSLVFFSVIAGLSIIAIVLLCAAIGLRIVERGLSVIVFSTVLLAFPFSQALFSRAGKDAARDVSSSLPFVMVVELTQERTLEDLDAAADYQLLNFDQDRLLHASESEVFILRRFTAGAPPAVIRMRKSPDRAFVVINPWSAQ